MRMAAITITQNDGYKFKKWCEHYEEYKEAIALQIIVDNASAPEYLLDYLSYCGVLSCYKYCLPI